MLGWYRRLLPREDRFFDMFARHSETLVQASRALEQLLSGKDVEANGKRIFELEDQADGITREVMLALRKSFITPFDRNDIKDLIQSMDDAIDTMRKTVKTVTLFEQTEFEPLMKDMGVAIVEAARLTAQSLPLLNASSANAQMLTELAEEIIKLEDQSDAMHDRGLKELFRKCGKKDPMGYIIGREIYSDLEKVLDRFEDVANEISGIVIENV